MAKFIIDYRFRGRGTDTIEADSLEAAQAIVDARLDDDEFDPPCDDYTDIDATVSEMHPVTRAGKEIWTTNVLPFDTRGHASALGSSPLFASLSKQEG